MSKQKTLLDVYQTMDAEQKQAFEYVVGLLVQNDLGSDNLEQSGIGSLEDFLAVQGVSPSTDGDHTKT